MNKTTRILALVRNNPNLSTREIANQAKCSRNHAYKVRKGMDLATVDKSKPSLTIPDETTTAFRKLVVRIGTDNAERMLAQIKTTIT